MFAQNLDICLHMSIKYQLKYIIEKAQRAWSYKEHFHRKITLHSIKALWLAAKCWAANQNASNLELQ